MKQAFNIALCLCLLVPFLGTYSWLHHEKRQVKREIKRQIAAGLDKNELVFHQFSLADSKTKLQWHHSKEYEFQGQMYDIVESCVEGDSILYWCWWDKAETALNKQLAELVAQATQDDPRNAQQKQRLTDFLKTLVASKGSVCSGIEIFSQRNRPAIDPTLSQHRDNSPPPSPPPERV